MMESVIVMEQRTTEDTAMNRTEVALLLGRRMACKSLDRAMAVIADGYDMVSVWEGGSDASMARARGEHPGAHFVTLAKGLSPSGDRIGVFYPKGYVAPRMF